MRKAVPEALAISDVTLFLLLLGAMIVFVGAYVGALVTYIARARNVASVRRGARLGLARILSDPDDDRAISRLTDLVAGDRARLPQKNQDEADAGRYLDSFIYSYEVADDLGFRGKFGVTREDALLLRARHLREIVRRQRPYEGLELEVQAEFKAVEEAASVGNQALAVNHLSGLGRRFISNKKALRDAEDRNRIAVRLAVAGLVFTVAFGITSLVLTVTK